VTVAFFAPCSNIFTYLLTYLPYSFYNTETKALKFNEETVVTIDEMHTGETSMQEEAIL